MRQGRRFLLCGTSKRRMACIHQRGMGCWFRQAGRYVDAICDTLEQPNCASVAHLRRLYWSLTDISNVRLLSVNTRRSGLVASCFLRRDALKNLRILLGICVHCAKKRQPDTIREPQEICHHSLGAFRWGLSPSIHASHKMSATSSASFFLLQTMSAHSKRLSSCFGRSGSNTTPVEYQSIPRPRTANPSMG